MLEITSDPLCTHRSRSEAHFTSSAFILNSVGQPLALFHKKLKRWLQPGGHIEHADQSLLDAAWREAKEESGLELSPLSPFPIDLDIHFIPPRSTEAGHWHFDVRFAFFAPHPEKLQESDESEGHVWLSHAKLEHWIQDHSIRRAFVGAFLLLCKAPFMENPPTVQDILEWDQKQVEAVFGQYV